MPPRLKYRGKRSASRHIFMKTSGSGKTALPKIAWNFPDRDVVRWCVVHGLSASGSVSVSILRMPRPAGCSPTVNPGAGAGHIIIRTHAKNACVRHPTLSVRFRFRPRIMRHPCRPKPMNDPTPNPEGPEKQLVYKSGGCLDRGRRLGRMAGPGKAWAGGPPKTQSRGRGLPIMKI
jgi:hypothetical protein